MRMGSRRIVISLPFLERSDGCSRATALVDGVPLWFETADADLTPAPEAFASALLFSSQHRARTLVVGSPLSNVWLDNASRILAIWNEWWGYKPHPPEAPVRTDSDIPVAATALMFSGGVDSFHTLLTGPRPEFLVSVHGYDMPLSDAKRMAGLRAASGAAAVARGMRAIVIRTNLREHPSYGRPSVWERGHGGGLGAIGHLLRGIAGRLVISSSWYHRNEKPWGSTSRTDPLFGSSGTAIDHLGGDTTREEKIAAIAIDPLVRQHLRVCWENRSPSGNCSRCEKCMTAMLHLTELDVLREFEVFEGADDLHIRLASVGPFRSNLNLAVGLLTRGNLEPRLSKALSAVVSRSRRAAPVLAWRSRIRDVLDRYV